MSLRPDTPAGRFLVHDAHRLSAAAPGFRATGVAHGPGCRRIVRDPGRSLLDFA